jgi:hypothetical protein
MNSFNNLGILRDRGGIREVPLRNNKGKYERIYKNKQSSFYS